MGKDRLEEFIKDQVADYESEVNTEELWSNLQKKKRRKTPILFISLMGLGLLITVLGYFWMSNSNATTSSAQNINSTDTSYTNTKNENEVERSNADLSSQGVKDQASNTSIDNIVSEIEPTITETQRTIGNNKFSNPSLVKAKENTNNASTIPLENAINTNQNKGGNINRSGNTFIQESGLFSNSILTKDLKGIGSTGSGSLSKALIKDAIELNDVGRQPLDISILTLAHPDALSFNRVYPYFEFQNLPEQITSEVSLKKWSTSLGVYSGYYKGSRILESIDTTSALLSLRQENEQFVEAWDIGIELNLEHSTGFSLHTGLAYRQINDRSIFIEEDRDLSVPTPIGFQGVLVQVNRMERIRYNKIGMIDVPLMLGYRLERDRNSYSIKAGVNFNLQTRAKGNIINDIFVENEQVPSFISTADNELFKANIGIAYQIELGYHRVLSKGYALSVHPTFRYYTDAFNNPVSNSIDQKYRHIGLKLMLSRRF